MTNRKSHNESTDPKPDSASSRKNPMPWIAGVLLLLGIAAVGGFYWNSVLTVQEVRFEGHRLVSQEKLRAIGVPTGINPDSINYVKVRNRFEQLPYVKHADISVEPSGNLLVTITERQPVAMLIDGEKKIYVDREGVRLPLVLGKTVDVPVLYGFSAEPMDDTLASDAFDRVSSFLTSVRSNPVSDATISEIAWTKKEGLVALTNQNGVKLIFGKGDYDRRLRNWEAFYGKVIKQKGIEAMRSVDLRFKGQIVTREKEK